MIALNLYLERSSKKGAVKALFALSQEAIAEFHNTLVRLCWAEFGKEEFGRLIKEFSNAKGDVDALKMKSAKRLLAYT